jgi:hypothetical protein
MGTATAGRQQTVHSSVVANLCEGAGNDLQRGGHSGVGPLGDAYEHHSRVQRLVTRTGRTTEDTVNAIFTSRY